MNSIQFFLKQIKIPKKRRGEEKILNQKHWRERKM
jgi:hypothetical protein